MFLLQFPLFDSHNVWLGCCIIWTHLVLCYVSVSAFTFVLPRNEEWCGCGLGSSREGCCSMWAGEPGGMRPWTGWGGGAGSVPSRGSKLATKGRYSPGGQSRAMGMETGRGQAGVFAQVEEVGVAWHRHCWPQLRSALKPCIRPKLPGCWQAKGEAPLLTALFPHSSFHTALGAQLHPELAPRLVSRPGLPWGGMEWAWGRGSQQVLVQPSWLQGGWEAGKADV